VSYDRVVRRLLGLAIMFLSCLPFQNVGLPTLTIPLSSGMTAYAYGRGDSCGDSVGYPPLLGWYGACSGLATREPISEAPDGGGNDALEDAYERNGYSTVIDGPSYGGAEDFRAGKPSAAGDHPTPVVLTFGLADGPHVAERPTGGLLVLGLVVSALFLTGVGLLFWPERRLRAAQGVSGGEPDGAQGGTEAGQHSNPD
jgi:hypothetical protein